MISKIRSTLQSTTLVPVQSISSRTAVAHDHHSHSSLSCRSTILDFNPYHVESSAMFSPSSNPSSLRTDWSGLISYNVVLHCSGSDCISLVIGIRTCSLALLSRVDSSRKPFLLLHTCHDSLSACCTEGLRLTSRQDRVATWRRCVLPNSHTCTDVDIVWAENSTLPSTHRLHALRNRRAVLLASVSMVHPQLRSTRPDTTFWLCLSLGSDNTRSNANVHLVGSQPQSEIHSIENFAFCSFALFLVLFNGRLNTHSQEVGNSFRYGVPRDLSYGCLPSLQISDHETITAARMIKHGITT